MGLLENLLGSVKDTASISKATLLSHSTGTALSLRVAVLRATSHDASSLPSSRQLSSILSLGNCAPRATASAAVAALMSRLHRTRSAAVALKCLILLHSVIRGGSFILHDQISLIPAPSSNRINHLNLSAFRDGSSPAAWELSTWIRWYARYLEQILTTSGVLGHFVFSISSRLERKKAIENLPSILNSDLLREINSLIDILEEVARSPEKLDPSGGSKLVRSVIVLVAEDYSVAVEDLEIRIGEFTQRLSSLSFADSVEMFCALKRLDDCKERLSEVIPMTGNCQETALWRLTERLREDLVAASDKMEKLAVVSWRRVGKTAESDRFGERVLQTGSNSFRFSSNRFTFQC